MGIAKTNNNNKKKTTTTTKAPTTTSTSISAAAQLKSYWAAAVDEWVEECECRQTNSTENDNPIISANLLSLLKDVVDVSVSVSVEGSVDKDDTWWIGLAQEKLLQELNSLYEDYSYATAKDASLTDDFRSASCYYDEDSLVYGEIDLKGFTELLQSLPLPPSPSSPSSCPTTTTTTTSTTSTTSDNNNNIKRRSVFYDLGSGSGRAVFAARFVQDYDNCIGIELLPNLHEMAKSVHSLYKFGPYQSKLKYTHVEFVLSDLLNVDWWKDGTVVYVPNLLFDPLLMDRIAELAIKLQSGAYLIALKQFGTDATAATTTTTTTTTFPQAFELIQQRLVPMSWGDSNVYVYQRK